MSLRRLWQQVKNVYHVVQAAWWRAWYRWPDRRLTIYGVTGTNGKTTTCYVLTSMLAEAYGAPHVGMLTTVTFRVGLKEITNDTKMTTLPSRLIFSYLRRMVDAGVSHAVVEMTSHALDQRRLLGIRLAGAIILNVEREHLDYHGTMDEYAAAKQLMLDYLPPGAPVVGKADDPYVSKMLKRARARGLKVREFTEDAAQAVATPLPGEVNKQNVLAASLLAKAVGVADEHIRDGIVAVTEVPGRMETMTTPHGVKVVIDYAVTPDALQRLYQEVKRATGGQVYGILGAAGRRDRGKRPLMAAAVKKYADELILTREDPWDESEEQIFADLEKGLSKDDHSWRRIVDRREAIAYALKAAKQGDAIVVTGKGAEVGMGIGKEVIPWHERSVIEELIKQRDVS